MPSRISPLVRDTPLGSALNRAQFGELHARVVGAPVDAVWDALHSVRWADLTITRPLMALRAGGAAVDDGLRLLDPPGPCAPVFERPPRSAASGVVEKPWQLRPQPGRPIDTLDQLRAFDEPGWLKYGMEWALSPLPGDRTYLETTTLCEATDGYAERRFAPYWVAIRAFSGIIRRDSLRAIATAAERGSGSARTGSTGRLTRAAARLLRIDRGAGG